ncbi:MAG: hypothetical protein ISP90_11535 [Nevskia sp.]|nr:hypothetical protein [Nevskia sp.]
MSTRHELKLPADFTDLADIGIEWSLPTEKERQDRRATASMPELRRYYDRLQPRMTAIAAHLDQFEYGLDQLPAAERHLLQLAYMYLESAMAVEFYRRPEPPDNFPRSRFIIDDIRI